MSMTCRRSGENQISFTTGLFWVTSSGLLLSLAQSPVGFGFLATLALVPWIIAARHARPRVASLYGIALVVVHATASANWLMAAFASQGVTGWRNLLASLVAVLWAKGVLFGVTGWAVRQLRRRSRVCQIAIPSLLFGLSEYWIGVSPWGLPLLLLGHTQLSVPGVAQLAVAVGVPGISALLVAINCALASCVEKRPKARTIAIALCSAWGLTAVCGMPLALGLRSNDGPATHSLLVIQPMIDARNRWNPTFQGAILEAIMLHTEAARRRATKMPDAILWPENVLTTPLSEDAALARRLQERVDELGLPVVLGMVRAAKSEERGAYRNSVAWWSPGLGEQDAVDKVRAIPVLESGRDFPGRSVLTRIFNLPASTPKVVEADRPRPLRGRFTLAPALCFEILFPRLISQRRTADSLAIVNFADDSWVASETLDRQLITAAAFRAIEQRLTLIRVAHGGLSVVIDPFGREIASLPPDTDSDMSVGVSKSKPISFFERAAILALPILGWLAARALCAAIARRGWGLHAESRER